MKKYLVKIEDSVLPQSYTFDQLIEAGLLDNFDDQIKVKLEGDSIWITARDYPFSNVENNEGSNSTTIQSEYHPSTRQVVPPVRQYSTTETPHYVTQQHRTGQTRRTEPVKRTHQRQNDILPTTPSILYSWSWGAFCLSWIWGIYNGIYWPLIIIACNFIPYIGVLCSLGICVYLGLKGNEMAWDKEKQKGTDVYTFESTQGTWNMVGLVLFFVSMLFGVLGCLIFIVLKGEL